MGLLYRGATRGTCLALILKANVRYPLVYLLLYLCDVVRSYAVTDVEGGLTRFYCQDATAKFPSLKILEAGGIRNTFFRGWCRWDEVGFPYRGRGTLALGRAFMRRVPRLQVYCSS